MKSNAPLLPVIALTYAPHQHVGFVSLQIGADIILPYVREAKPEDVVLKQQVFLMAGNKLSKLIIPAAPLLGIPDDEMQKMCGPWLGGVR